MLELVVLVVAAELQLVPLAVVHHARARIHRLERAPKLPRYRLARPPTARTSMPQPLLDAPSKWYLSLSFSQYLSNSLACSRFQCRSRKIQRHSARSRRSKVRKERWQTSGHNSSCRNTSNTQTHTDTHTTTYKHEQTSKHTNTHKRAAEARTPPKHRNTATPKHRNTETPQHRNTATPQHRNTATPQHRNTETPKERNTATPKHRKSETSKDRKSEREKAPFVLRRPHILTSSTHPHLLLVVGTW